MIMAGGRNYQPVMIRTLIQNNGKVSKEKIMEELLKANQDHEFSHFVNCEVFRVLTINHSIAIENKENKTFELIDFESYSVAEKAVIVRYCNQKIDRPFGVKLTEDSVDAVILEFKEWLETDEAKNHLHVIENEKKDVKEIMKKLDDMDKDRPEFVDWVLHGLLPHFKTKYAKRESTFPVFLNIEAFLKRYDYNETDWKNIANMIYDLANKFQKEPEKIGEWVKEFTSNKKYIRNIQTAAISPILFCLNDNYPLINNRIRQTYKEFAIVFGWNDEMSRKIEEYVKSSEQIKKLIDKLQVEELKDLTVFDVFCYWFDYLRKQDTYDDDETETIQKILESVNYDGFFQSIDFDNFRRFEPHLLRNPERVKIRDIIQFCDEGKWRLPNFQRYFDWKQKDIRDLLESIFRDYYVGSFLMWDMDNEPPLSINPILGAKPSEDSRTQSIILDGQQRMTSLYYAIKSPSISTRRIRKPVYYYIDFNTFFSDTNREKDYVIALDKKLEDEESFNSLYFPFYELEKYDDWIERLEKFILTKTSESEKFHKMRRIIEKKVKHIYDGFEIPYISLPTTMGLPEVTDIFEQINTKGKTLSVFDLLVAKLSSYDIQLKTLWDESIRNFENIKNYKSMEKLPIYILQSISLFYHKTNSCKKEDILKIHENIFGSSELSFDEVWEEFATYTDLAIQKLENLRDGFGIRDKGSLPYAPTIPILASLLKEIDDKTNKVECNSKLDIWYWSSIFGESFSAAVDSQLTTDFREMRKWFISDDIPRIVERVRREYKTTTNLRGVQSTSNAIFRGMLSLIALKGAIDFNTNRSLENARTNDKHHIFPKAPFKNPQINTILNQTWLSAETNRKIVGAKKPSKYIQEFIDDKYDGDTSKFKDVLLTHFINDAAFDSMMQDDFNGFIREREKILMTEIGNRIGITDNIQNETMLRPDREFDNELLVEDTFKKCDEYVDWVDGYFRQKGFTWISRYLPNDKVKQVRILTGKDTVNDELRDRFKALKSQLGHNDVKCEMRVITDNKIKRNIHGRWIVTKNNCFSFQSVDTVSRGSYDEIRDGAAVPPFDEWWDGSLDIINDWNKIKETIEEN
jgi:hypothetical protein